MKPANMLVVKKPTFDNIDSLSGICYGHVGCMVIENLEIFLQASI